ncbi:MAG: HEAT repeat domain-containing protein [Phycisphaeraceae bacterium]
MPAKPRHYWNSLSALLLAGLLLAATSGCETLGKGDNPVASLVESFSPPTPGDAARQMFNPFDPDKRRNGVALISSSHIGGDEVYLRAYRTLITDEDATVKAACVRALGLHGTADDAKLIAARLEDRVPNVRLEAAQALQKIRSEEAITPLSTHLRAPQPGQEAGEESADVRAACAYALGQYPQGRVFDALVGALNDADYSVVYAARHSLKTLVGYDLGSDATLWIIWGRKNETNLFAKQEKYTWQPFDKGPGFFDHVQFWKDREVPQPKVPVGTEAKKEEGSKSSS